MTIDSQANSIWKTKFGANKAIVDQAMDPRQWIPGNGPHAMETRQMEIRQMETRRQKTDNGKQTMEIRQWRSGNEMETKNANKSVIGSREQGTDNY